ncbi:DNA topoisomerase III, partial [Pseudomonas aeruginosa]|nr:DNA topoisomerase III [Pseudomonas aeruginosa]
MKLYIAEKPSVANDIAKALGGSIQKKNGYIE